MFHFAVVEDNCNDLLQFEKCLDRYSKESKKSIQYSDFSDGMTFLNQYIPRYDIIFLDISMPKIDGMTIARQIREKDKQVMLVFTTCMAQYAINGYEVRAMDFILKPILYPSFSLKLDRYIRCLEAEQNQSLVIPQGSGWKRLYINQIYYLEVIQHHIYFYSSEGTYKCSSSLKKMEQLLKGCSFSKCNSCYLVNLRHVQEVKKDSILVAGHELQMSRRNRKNFMMDLTRFSL